MLCHKRLQNPASKMYVYLLEICMHLGRSFDLIPKRRGPNIVYLNISEQKGLIGEVSGKLVGRNFPHWKQLQ